MAMINCPECGKEISDKAMTCPNCGAPVEQRKTPEIEVQSSKDLSERYRKMGAKKKTQICKHCKSEIPKGAKVCPYCKKKQSSVAKWVIIALIVLVLIGSITSGNGETEKPHKASNDDTVPQVTQVENNPSSQIEKENGNKNEFSIGEIAEYKDVQIVVTGYEESSGNDWGTPDEGMTFVFPEIEIVNNSDEEIGISSMLSFECYVDDYKTDFSSSAFMAISTDKTKQQLDGSIAPGKKLKGVLGIEASQDWETIEIYYKDNVWLDSNFSFIISRK